MDRDELIVAIKAHIQKETKYYQNCGLSLEEMCDTSEPIGNANYLLSECLDYLEVN